MRNPVIIPAQLYPFFAHAPEHGAHDDEAIAMTQATNPYQAPAATLAESEAAETYGKTYGKVGFFRSTRIGRIRYLAYGMIATLLFVIASTTPAFVSMANSKSEDVLVAAAYFVLFCYQWHLTIRRCHDFNATGWFSLLLFVPLVNLLFVFIPGSKGENRFGPKPLPNPSASVVIAVIGCILLGGILAAFTVSAYWERNTQHFLQDLAKRTHAAQTLEQNR
jgi:uncharacterized membrane protein YhaH (DUF805 family)